MSFCRIASFANVATVRRFFKYKSIDGELDSNQIIMQGGKKAGRQDDKTTRRNALLAPKQKGCFIRLRQKRLMSFLL